MIVLKIMGVSGIIWLVPISAHQGCSISADKGMVAHLNGPKNIKRMTKQA